MSYLTLRAKGHQAAMLTQKTPRAKPSRVATEAESRAGTAASLAKRNPATATRRLAYDAGMIQGGTAGALELDPLLTAILEHIDAKLAAVNADLDRIAAA
jgi:hypothetical protein